MAAAGRTETEIKLPVSSADAARRLLRDCGFRVHRRRIFEDNTIFDTRRLRLRRSASLLRVRVAGRRATLTYKGRPSPGRHKSREEIEITVSDPHAMAEIAGRLGFHPVFRYQKYRTEYKQHGSSGIATLDETPIGVFLELEGSPSWIDRTARRLGFGERDYITGSYAGLYFAWCKTHHVRPGEMVFS